MKRSLLLWILFIAVLAISFLHAAEATEPSGQGTARQEILVLNSYHPGFAWSDDEQAGIIDVLQAKDKDWLPVIEYLDLKRLPDGRHLAELKQLFRRKHRNKKFSVVIAMDNPALEFVIDNQAELFRNAPIVFCGINNYAPSLLKGRTNVTGIVEAIDIAGTIEVMLRLHPAAREIFVPHDYTVTGLAARKAIEALIPRFGARVRFRFTDPLTMGELLKELERLPADSLVLPISFITDKSGRTFGMTESTGLFSEHSPVPVYSTFEQRLGFGIVGGKLLSARHHGAHAARLALRVLAGEKASTIPVVFESDSQFMFDYKVMNRFGIPLSALPEGSTVINKPASFYAAHRAVIQTALGIIVFLTIVIFLLTINIIQRRRSVIALRESEDRLRTIVEASLDAIIAVNTEGRLVLFNGAAQELFQYSEKEALNQPADILLREEICKIHQERLERFLKRGVRRCGHIGRRMERFFRRKDGSLFEAEVSMSGGRLDGLRLVVLTIHDITERKQAEEALHRSEENFRRSLDDSPLGVRIVTAEGETIYANRAILNIYGYDSIEELNTTPLKKRYTPESYAEFQKRMEKRNQGDYDPSEYEINIVRKDGEVRQLQVFRKTILWDGEKQFEVIYQDITERRRAESEIQALARFPSENPNPILRIARDGTLLYVNVAGLNQLREWHLKAGRGVPSMIRDVVSESLNIGKSRLLDLEHCGRIYSFFVAPIVDAGYANLYGRDITESKRAEEEIFREKLLSDSIVNNIPAGVAFLDNDFVLRKCNRGYGDLIRKYTPYTPEQAMGMSYFDYVSGSRPQVEAWFQRVRDRAQAETIFDFELTIHQDQREEKTYWDTSVAPVLDPAGKVGGVLILTQDVTERNQAKEALRASREQMRALAGRLQAGREEERTQIAREIHDELGGALTGMKIDFSLLTRAVLKMENGPVRTSLLAGMDSMIKSVDAAIQTVRRIAMELRPGILDDLGLVAALEWQLIDFEKRTSIRCEFFPPVEDISLDADLSTALFRIFQEALTNVARHSGATEVRVRLHADAGAPTLEVEDNGKGIEKEKTLSSKSLGLLGMRERAQMFGGRLTVSGTPGTSTKVTVEILPVEKRKMDRDRGETAG